MFPDELRDEFFGALNSLASTFWEEIKEMKETLMGEINVIRADLDVVKGDIVLCKTSVAGGATIWEGPRVKVPEPPKFAGKRDAKELDNFLWCVERYFEDVHMENDASKISTATMYLTEDAILSWRMRHGDAEPGETSISTWAEFKAGFKRQFYPENSEELAMNKLRSLKHTGSIKEYIKQYSTRMLEISDMPEKSRLLYFMDGLQRWAEQELRRCNVQDLEQAISVAESLIEFQRETRKDKLAKKGSSDKGKGGGAKPNAGGSKSFKNDKSKDKGKTDRK